MNESISATVKAVKNVTYTQKAAAIAELFPICHTTLLLSFFRSE
jgi:hypothetical protein